MKDAGCVAVYYGMETGSPAILEIMEKKATLQDNLNAAKWTQEAGIFTIFQMVLGMPGESPKTIRETIDFLKTVTQDLPESPRSRMSLNYIQALPGTPVYEYARQKGLIGKSLADEEAYLIAISDVDAADDTKMLNFTDYDYLTVRSWRREIVLEVMKHYRKHHRMQAPSLLSFAWSALKKKVFKDRGRTAEDFHETARLKVINDYSKGGYFNLQRDLAYDAIVAYAYPLHKFILAFWLLQDEFRHLKFSDFLKDVGAWLRRRMTGAPRPSVSPVSLRLTVADGTPRPTTPTETAMAPLRDGR
ncbi:MAG: radical SAM protein, partial [Elusimicrobiota bacterium]